MKILPYFDQQNPCPGFQVKIQAEDYSVYTCFEYKRLSEALHGTQI